MADPNTKAPATPTIKAPANKAKLKRNVDAVLDAISSTVVNSQSMCLAMAENRILLQFAGANNVTIENLTVNMVADAEVSSCSQTNSFDIDALNKDVTTALNDLLGPTVKTKSKIIEDIKNFVNIDLVQKCYATSLNRYNIEINKVGNDVFVKDLNIEQIAKSTVKDVIQNNTFKIGTDSLSDYLDKQLEETAQVPPVAPIDSTDCEATQKKNINILIGVSLGIGAFIIIITIFWIIYRRSHVAKVPTANLGQPPQTKIAVPVASTVPIVPVVPTVPTIPAIHAIPIVPVVPTVPTVPTAKS